MIIKEKNKTESKAKTHAKGINERVLIGVLTGCLTTAVIGGLTLGGIQLKKMSGPVLSASSGLSGTSSQNLESVNNSASAELSGISRDENGISSETADSSTSSGNAGSSGNSPTSLVKSSVLASSTLLSRSSSTAASVVLPKGNELIQDPSFLRGFRVKGLNTITDGNTDFGYFDYDGDDNERSTSPLWDLAAWYSGYNIGLTHTYTKLGDGYYRYEDTNKKVTINTKEASISLRLDASKYYTAPRKNGENWPHLLIGQGGKDFSRTEYFAKRKIDSMKELRVTFDTRMTYFNDAMGDTANPGLHGSGFYIYLYIQDLNKGSEGYGEMIWFGLPLFDNRTAWLGEFAAADGGKADASGMFIYQIPQRQFMPDTLWQNGKPSGSVKNPWIHVDYDCMAYVKHALELAHERNYMKNTTLDELYFNGFNIGWEMYGTYDGEIAVKNYHVTAIPK